MAITGRLVDDKAFTTNVASYASDVPSAGSETETHLCWVINSHGTDATLPTLSGGGLTWSEVRTVVFGGSRNTLFRARGTNTAAAVTADFGGTNQTGCIIIWGAAAGVDGTTDEGVVQSAGGNLGSGTSGEATLAAIGANNAVFSGAMSGVNSAHTAEDPPFTELSDLGYGTPATRGHMMWAVTTDTTPTHTAASSTFWRIVAVELKAESADVDATVAQTLPALTQDADGTLDLSGSAASVLPALGQSSTAEVVHSGTAAQTLPVLSQQATGTLAHSATGVSVLPALETDAQGTLAISAAAAATLPALSQVATGTVSGAPVTATVASLLPALSQAVSGTLGGESWRVIVPSAAAAVTSSGSGTIDPPTGSAVTGPGGGTIDPPTSPPITVP